MKRKHLIIFLFCIPPLIPLTSFLLWKVKENRPLKVLIYDMTVPLHSYIEHNSFSWVLLHQKFTSFDQLIQPALDYKGFFPKSNFKFITKDFLKLTNQEVNLVADSLLLVQSNFHQLLEHLHLVPDLSVLHQTNSHHQIP